MKSLLRYATLFYLALASTNCATWKDTTRAGLNGAFETMKFADSYSNPILHKRCLDIAKVCGEKTPGTCPALKTCQKLKTDIEDGIIAVHQVIASGLIAVTLGEKLDAATLFAKTLAIVSKVREAMRLAGVLQ